MIARELHVRLFLASLRHTLALAMRKAAALIPTLLLLTAAHVLAPAAEGSVGLVSPPPGSTLTGSSVTFTWSAGNAVTSYQLCLGNTGVGSCNLNDSGHTPALSASVTALPTYGQKIYARLYSETGGKWSSLDYTYIEAGSPVPAALSTPAPASKLPGSSVTFTWTAGGGVESYQLFLGTMGVGSDNLYDSGHTIAASVSVTGLPGYGQKIYARLYSDVAGVWQSADYTYTESGSPLPAALTTPAPGSTLSGPSTTFSWTAGSGVASYQLVLGSAGKGSYNLYDSGHTLATSESVTGLPTNGKTIYARLYSDISGTWQSVDYTYVASNGAGAPVITITMNPTSNIPGYWSTLAWSTTNAISCTASGGWMGTEPLSGSLSVALAATTAYTLTCTGAGGSNHATATETITPTPVVTLTASSSSIASGASTTLTWTATNTTSCTASGGSWTGTQAASGSASVSPASTTTYALSCAWPGGTAQASTVVFVDAAPFGIHVSGNHFVNAAGNTVQLRGVNLSGFEYVGVQGWDPTDPSGGSFGQPFNPNWTAIKNWKANVVRIPMNEDSWLGLTCVDTDGLFHNTDPGSNYRASIASMVQEANAAGLYVSLDLHWTLPGNACPMQQAQMADTDHSLAFWTSVAGTFKNNPAVMFELFNEPFLDFDWTGSDQWAYLMNGTDGMFSGYPATSNGGNSQNIATPWNIASYQAMINGVRATGATNVVLIGSLSYTADLSGWLSHVPTDSAGQMAATWHAYPTYGETWENPCTGSDTYCTPGFSPQVYTEVQDILLAGYPVLTTETGDQDSTGTVGSPLVANLTAFADAPGKASTSTEPGVSWPAVSGLPQIGVLGWTWDVWGGAEDDLVLDVNGTPTDGFGQFFQSWMVNHP